MNNVAFYTILRRELVRVLRIWPQTLLPPIIMTSLYFVIFGQLIGARIGVMDGFSYIQYITPGLIMMSIITNSYANVSSSFFSMKFQRNIEELLIAPISNAAIIWGYILSGALRGLTTGLLVAGVAAYFTDFNIHSYGVTVLIAALTAILFALAGLVNAIFAQKFDDVMIIPTFVLTPLTYLGGVFYSIKMLPEFWQGISHANPVLYMINGFRYGMLGITDISIYTSIAVIVSFTAALYTLCWWLFSKGYGLRS